MNDTIKEQAQHLMDYMEGNVAGIEVEKPSYFECLNAIEEELRLARKDALEAAAKLADSNGPFSLGPNNAAACGAQQVPANQKWEVVTIGGEQPSLATKIRTIDFETPK